MSDIYGTVKNSVVELLEIGGEVPTTHEELARVSGLAVEQVREAVPHIGHIIGAARRTGKSPMLPGDRRSDILAAGLEFVRANGYRDVTCEAVGEAAGCSYNTVRRHWSNRRLLVEAIALEAKRTGDKALWRQGMKSLGQ